MMAGEINEDTIFESGYDRGRKEEREKILKIIEKFNNRFHFMIDDLIKEIEWEAKIENKKRD